MIPADAAATGMLFSGIHRPLLSPFVGADIGVPCAGLPRGLLVPLDAAPADIVVAAAASSFSAGIVVLGPAWVCGDAVAALVLLAIGVGVG